jgi:kynurenine/2-aminoadipate aminotransferase
MISLGGGMPNPDKFPFENIQVTLRGGGSFDISGKALNVALQYASTLGLPSLVRHLEEIQRREHGAAQPTPSKIMVTTGSQDGLSKAFDMFCAGPDDSLIVENPTYSGSLAYLQPIGCRLYDVACDDGGMVPEALRNLLRNWDASREGRPRPRVMYTIPTGSNPSGTSLSLARKQEIYAIAREYGLLILEDDPYYWMQFGSSRVPSLLSMDVDGRVLRFDSFSKLLSSGIRVGFCTGPPALIERLELHAQASILHSGGVSQALVAGIFDQWEADEANGGSSYPAFVRHCADIADFYKRKRDTFLSCADKHLKGLCKWVVPNAGMFIWLKLPVADADQFVKTKARDAKVLLVPGQSFDPHNRPGPYCRAAYSTATDEEMDAALSRLGELLRAG